jgi:hypothetical protein
MEHICDTCINDCHCSYRNSVHPQKVTKCTEHNILNKKEIEYLNEEMKVTGSY